MCWMSCGYAESGSSPRPAVRLVPAKRMIGFATPPEDATTRGEDESVIPETTVVAPLACAVSVDGALPEHANVSSNSTYLFKTFRPSEMLSATGLTKEYQSGDHRLTVLRDVNFSIAQGEFVAIVGPSGSGKTTLLGLLAGLDTPSRGSVHLDGIDITALDEDARARVRGEKVGFIFQSFQLIPTLTAIENVQVPLELRGDDAAVARARDVL